MSETPLFMPYQKKWLNDSSKLKIWEKSRRIGATYVQSWEDFKYALNTGRKVWFSSADESAAREYIDYMREWAQMLNVVADVYDDVAIDEDKDIKALQIRLPNDATINAMTSNPNRFRSKGGKVVWDEAAHHKDPDAMWRALQPSAMWGDPIVVLSTHRGKRTFYKLIQKIKEGKAKGNVHTTTIVDAVRDGIVDKIYGRPTTEEERNEWLKNQKDQCIDEIQWYEEFMCQPMDEADAFLSYEMIAAIEDSGVLWKNGVPEHVSGNLYLGMDIGRRKDLSIIWIVEKLGVVRFTRAVIVLNRVPFRQQREMLYKYLAHPNMRRACIDDTGIGMQLAEEAQEDFGKYKVEPVTFTGAVKEGLAYPLRRSVEEKTLIIPSSQEIREDLHSVRKAFTPSGNIRFDVESSVAGHADRFWALALADQASQTFKGMPSVASSGTRQADNILSGFEYGGITGF
ncbi:MAG: terminase family protein [Balneolales bacterium]